MLNALSVCLQGGDPDGQLRASRSFGRQGFVPAESFDWPGGRLDTWSHPSQSGTGDASIRVASGFACCVGPLWYRGRFASEALALMIDEVDHDRWLDETVLRGNFALFISKGTQRILMNDALGLVRIHASRDRQFYSTSWLTTCAYSGNVELDEAAAAEYVLLGASHSEATVARGIATLPLGHAFDLEQRRTCARFAPGSWSECEAPASFDGACDAAEALLRASFSEVAATFPGQVRAALSGGFDSRLILAGLLAHGQRPELFVYGKRTLQDVSVARAVAAGAGISIDVIDKGEWGGGARLPDMERLVENGLFFDGLPADGIHDAGADQQTRLAQTAGGYLVLNGGGGEIYRNYFHLPDRPFRPTDIVHTFYRGFDSAVFRHPGGLRAYQERLACSMERSLGLNGRTGRSLLTREQVELLYPLFRCHHWMAVNNSVSVRHGCYTTPLVDFNMVRLACRIPLVWKNAGALESRLIAGLHPKVAAHPSTHGFRFTDGPGRRARLSAWATRRRPVFARPAINTMHRQLSRQHVTSCMIQRCRTLLPGEWRMDPILDLGRLPDDGAYGRALAIEVAWRTLLA